VQQLRRATVATPGEWQCRTWRRAAARSGEWAQHFSNASCFKKSTQAKHIALSVGMPSRLKKERRRKKKNNAFIVNG